MTIEKPIIIHRLCFIGLINSTFRGWVIIIEAGFHNNNCADFDSVDSSDHSTGNLLERAARDWSDLRSGTQCSSVS